MAGTGILRRHEDVIRMNEDDFVRRAVVKKCHGETTREMDQ